MPRLDGTGPMGQGPRTGWGMGRCPRFPSQVRGGRALTKEEMLKTLEEEKKAIENEIKELEKTK